MKRKVKVAQFGIGRMGSLMVRYIVEHGGEYVAAFARNPNQIGKDLGEIAGIGSLGVVISDAKNAAEVLAATRPDIGMITTQGSMALNKPYYEVCARNGANAISIGEHCLWPYTSDAGIAEELDQIAKECGVTLSASGCPEVTWGTLVTTLISACNKITKIKGDTMLNVDDYGPSVSDMHGVDLTLEDFEAHFPEIDMLDGHFPCLPGDQNAFLADHLGLHIVSQKMKHVPLIAEQDVYCKNLDRVIRAGRVIGDYMQVASETEEGVSIELWIGGKVYTEGEQDWNKWDIFGEPECHFTLYNPATPQFTCATPVNKIPDVINAAPGFLVASKLPVNTFKVRDLNEYVIEK